MLLFTDKTSLEKTEMVIKNGQSRNIDNIWVHKTQNEDKQNKTKINIENYKDEQL